MAAITAHDAKDTGAVVLYHLPRMGPDQEIFDVAHLAVVKTNPRADGLYAHLTCDPNSCPEDHDRVYRVLPTRTFITVGKA